MVVLFRVVNQCGGSPRMVDALTLFGLSSPSGCRAERQSKCRQRQGQHWKNGSQQAEIACRPGHSKCQRCHSFSILRLAGRGGMVIAFTQQRFGSFTPNRQKLALSTGQDIGTPMFRQCRGRVNATTVWAPIHVGTGSSYF